MNGPDVLRIVDAIHRDKNIDKDIVFEGIEQAIVSAARKHFGEESDVQVAIDRETGDAAVACDGQNLDADEIGDLLGRIAAQTAKQVMIQKIREAERDSLYDEFTDLRGHIVTGTVSRIEHGSATVNLGKVEAILPRGEQIPGESHRVGERVRAVVLEVKKAGTRVKIILSRTHPELVRRLFELEIPEVAEHVIEVRSLAREAGYRSKVAVSCYDSKIDAVGACVGVRGSRIKSVVDELAGERIDIVRWNDSLQVLVPNALQPAEVEDVILCPMLGKVIVLVREDNLSLAIGKKGQNVRLASKLVGWDIHVMTQERLDEQLDVAVAAFSKVPGIAEELAENLVAQGFFTFDDLSVIEPDQLAELGSLSPEECEAIVEFADREAVRQEEQEKIQALRAAHEQASAAAAAREEAAQAAAASAAAAEAEGEASTQAGAEPEAAESEVAEPEAEPAAEEVAVESAAQTDGEPVEETAAETVEHEPTAGNGRLVADRAEREMEAEQPSAEAGDESELAEAAVRTSAGEGAGGDETLKR
ncbi:MAG: transcription termination factor NusA [Planctomycetes bacterium]|nr:transcription termination factor NusA [Planctomycetota bacterium]